LLSPTFSAKAIDKSILQHALGGDAGPAGEVWSAKTVKSNRCFVYVFVADLERDWELHPADVGLDDRLTYRLFESSAPSEVHDFSG
jgi:hypothetical protein